MSIVWNDKGLLVNDTQFQLIVGLNDLIALKEDHGLVLGKTREMVDTYMDLLAGFPAQHIFELGIFRGGSTAFFNELLRPAKLVAIDFMKKPKRGFRDYMNTGANAGSIRPYFGVDQADTQRLQEICDEELGDVPLDLVIDDASHMLEETRTSFNFLFPKLRPGGLYIIEDWGWAHVPDATGAFEKMVGERAPLSNLIIEIMLASTRKPLLFPEIRVFSTSVIIRRGECDIDPDFDISQLSFYWNHCIGRTNLFDRQRLELLPDIGRK
ncbi:class I SAM-dependent methyltransferase [Parvibaculum sp.]|uniref:class I SAM-dependent methyltransferase n=1 Tax=Parvibaculum sp. TaxID=2024848 RepID=UPI003BA9D7CB